MAENGMMLHSVLGGICTAVVLIAIFARSLFAKEYRFFHVSFLVVSLVAICAACFHDYVIAEKMSNCRCPVLNSTTELSPDVAPPDENILKKGNGCYVSFN